MREGWLNKEVKRRTRVATLFLNESSRLRLAARNDPRWPICVWIVARK